MQDKLMSEERKHEALKIEEEKKMKEEKLKAQQKRRAQEESEAVSVCMKFSRIYFLLHYIILHALFLLL